MDNTIEYQAKRSPGEIETERVLHILQQEEGIFVCYHGKEFENVRGNVTTKPDHVLITQGGIFCMDSKHWKGNLEFFTNGLRCTKEDDSIVIFQADKDPVNQLRNQTAVLRELVDSLGFPEPIPIYGLDVFTQPKKAKLLNQPREFHAIYLRELVGFIQERNQTEILKPSDITKIANLFNAKSKVPERPIVKRKEDFKENIIRHSAVESLPITSTTAPPSAGSDELTNAIKEMTKAIQKNTQPEKSKPQKKERHLLGRILRMATWFIIGVLILGFVLDMTRIMRSKPIDAEDTNSTVTQITQTHAALISAIQQSPNTPAEQLLIPRDQYQYADLILGSSFEKGITQKRVGQVLWLTGDPIQTNDGVRYVNKIEIPFQNTTGLKKVKAEIKLNPLPRASVFLDDATNLYLAKNIIPQIKDRSPKKYDWTSTTFEVEQKNAVTQALLIAVPQTWDITSAADVSIRIDGYPKTGQRASWTEFELDEAYPDYERYTKELKGLLTFLSFQGVITSNIKPLSKPEYEAKQISIVIQKHKDLIRFSNHVIQRVHQLKIDANETEENVAKLLKPSSNKQVNFQTNLSILKAVMPIMDAGFIEHHKIPQTRLPDPNEFEDFDRNYWMIDVFQNQYPKAYSDNILNESPTLAYMEESLMHACERSAKYVMLFNPNEKPQCEAP